MVWADTIVGVGSALAGALAHKQFSRKSDNMVDIAAIEAKFKAASDRAVSALEADYKGIVTSVLADLTNPTPTPVPVTPDVPHSVGPDIVDEPEAEAPKDTPKVETGKSTVDDVVGLLKRLNLSGTANEVANALQWFGEKGLL